MQTTAAHRAHVRSLAAVLLAIAAALGLLATAGTAQASTTTRVKIKVSGCEGCALTPVSFRGAMPAYRTRTVVGGVVVFTLPKAATRGLGFFIENNAADAYFSAKTLVVARYKGLVKGNPVPGYRARNGHYATQCWAGTTRDRVTLTMTVKHYRTTNDNGSSADAVRAYFNPTVASIGTPWATWNGGLYTQSVINCSGRSPN